MISKVIGIDIGGSKVRIILREGGRFKSFRAFKIPKRQAGFRKLIFNLIRASGARRAGIGCAGVINGKILATSPNIPFLRRFDFRKVVPAVVRFSLDNDARCFGRAEYSSPGIKKTRRALFFTFGTGVGRAYGEAGKIKKIKKFEYPENWEKNYKTIKGSKLLAPFLAIKLKPLILRYRPALVVVGGAAGERRDFLPLFRTALRREKIICRVRRSRLGEQAGARGAALST